jgi:PAS domain S-box-containing protein
MSALEKAHILVVDDEPQILVALEDLLSHDFVVYKSQSAEQALNVMTRRHDIAVVISDQRMPGMPGDQLFAALGDDYGALRILLTGFADLSAVTRAVNDGRIFAYVTKPWNSDDLQLKVRKAAEHFRLERELEHERQLLHDLMDNIPDGIYFKDQDLRFIRANRGYAKLLGSLAPSQVVGRRLSDLRMLDPRSQAVETEERQILENDKPTSDVIREHEVEGERQWFSETTAPIRGRDGEVIGLVGVSRNVTQRIRLEEQLAQAQKMEAIGMLAGGVAHDFNNLLAVIGSYGELALEDLRPEDPLRSDLEELLAATRRAASLTGQLLAFTRRQVVQPRPLNLNDTVANVERMLRRIVGEDIELITRLSPSLAMVRADPGHIEQIVMNLAANARDAMPGGGRLTIATSSTALTREYAAMHPDATPGAGVLLSVTDTGTGMDSATQKRIFEPFFTTKDVGKGTGLGLSTVYGIVQQNGGHIMLESALGHGTTFKIHFPQIAGSSAIDEPALARPSLRPHSDSSTILLVEDDAAVRRVAVRILRDQGYTVFEANRAKEAIDLCKRGNVRVDLLVTDIIMPEMSGPKLAEELCVSFPGLLVLYMSGYPATMGSTAVPPGEQFLQKPFSPTSLAGKVRDVLAAETRTGA